MLEGVGVLSTYPQNASLPHIDDDSSKLNKNKNKASMRVPFRANDVTMGRKCRLPAFQSFRSIMLIRKQAGCLRTRLTGDSPQEQSG